MKHERKLASLLLPIYHDDDESVRQIVVGHLEWTTATLAQLLVGVRLKYSLAQNNGLIQVITGIRRCGKSYFLPGLVIHRSIQNTTV